MLTWHISCILLCFASCNSPGDNFARTAKRKYFSLLLQMKQVRGRRSVVPRATGQVRGGTTNVGFPNSLSPQLQLLNTLS